MEVFIVQLLCCGRESVLVENSDRFFLVILVVFFVVRDWTQTTPMDSENCSITAEARHPQNNNISAHELIILVLSFIQSPS